MNKITGTTIFIIVLMFTVFTTLSDHTVLQYIALFLGLILAINSVFQFDKVKKAEVEKERIQLSTWKNK
ncbi:hypothetical protein DET49_10158 [Salegentibacter sp. 24]|nr:hypothetical protein DET49_10158 [Salegentibacter sp. 24]